MANYPREIYLDSETEEKLISYIETEIFNHYAERSEHIEDLIRWQKEYWAKPTTEEATFPYRGASTLVVPLNAIAIEAIHAGIMTTRFALQDLVSAHAIDNDWEDVQVPVERFMNRELVDVMKVRTPVGDCFLEATKYGTMVGKVQYEKMTKTSVRQLADGTEQEIDVVVKDGAQFDPVPESRFLMPYSAKDPQYSAWCGEERSETPYQVMLMEAGGLFRPGTIIDGPDWEHDASQVSKLHDWISRTTNTTTGVGGNKVEAAQESLEHRQPQWPKRIDWFELYLPFDTDQSGRLKEIVVLYHRDSRTLMSCRYNWYSNLRRPYRTGVMFPIEHRWTGIGTCKQNEQFQPEITTQHRQRLDNATLANMRMLKVHKLSGYGPREPVFPGKMWFLNDMSHIESFQMGEVYPSSFQNEQASLIYSQQRTGVNEVTLGQPQVGTPGTATSDLARIQEGNKKKDFIYANFNSFLNEIIVDVADVIQQFGPRQVSYFDTAEKGQLVKAFFQMPSSYIRDGLLISLKTTTQQANRLLDRQNWQQISQGLQQYYTGMIELSQLAGNPQLTQMIVMKGLGAATEAMRQFLETFDTRNVDRIVVKEIEDMVKNGLQTAGTEQGGNNIASQPGQAGGVDGLVKMLSAIGSNGSGAFGGVPFGR